MSAKRFEAALGIGTPWSVKSLEFDEAAKLLTVPIGFAPGSRFAIARHEGVHPVHDTVTKRYRHLNFYQHECCWHVRTPRAKAAQRVCAPGRAGLRGASCGLCAAVRSAGSRCRRSRCRLQRGCASSARRRVV